MADENQAARTQAPETLEFRAEVSAVAQHPGAFALYPSAKSFCAS